MSCLGSKRGRRRPLGWRGESTGKRAQSLSSSGKGGHFCDAGRLDNVSRRRSSALATRRFGQISSMQPMPTSPYGVFLGFDSSVRVVEVSGKIIF